MMKYTTTGNGKPIVLIHGFGEDSKIWQLQVKVLQEIAQVIVPELPGTGRTAMEPVVTMESMADGIAEILDHEKITKAIIIGHSMGGYITLAFAEKYPERLTAFGLVHSTAYADSEQKKAARYKSMEFIRQHGTSAFLESTTPNLFAAENRPVMDKTIRDLALSVAYILPGALISFLEAMIKRNDKTLILRESRVPVLFIVGKEDQAVPFSDTMQQVHLPELSYIHILQQSGHMSMLEETEKCTKAILQFAEKAQ
jgi:pimeloyl-ACP methyl ester carboxylesterase